MRGYGSSRKNVSKIFDKGCLEDFRFSLDFKDLNKKESIMTIEAFLPLTFRKSYTTTYHYLNLWKPLLPAAKQTTLKVDSQKLKLDIIVIFLSGCFLLLSVIIHRLLIMIGLLVLI